MIDPTQPQAPPMPSPAMLPGPAAPAAAAPSPMPGLAKAADMAKRLSQNLNEAPAGAQELTPEQVKAMWFFSPTGSVAKADATFWQVHDQVLAQTGDHNQAETK